MELTNNGYVIALYVFAVIVTAYALEAKSNDAEVQKVIDKYLKKLPENIETKYIVDDGLAKIISHFFNYKVNAFPLFRVSIKYDRKPIKIPWTLDQGTRLNDTLAKEAYKYQRVKKQPQTKDNN